MGKDNFFGNNTPKQWFEFLLQLGSCIHNDVPYVVLPDDAFNLIYNELMLKSGIEMKGNPAKEKDHSRIVIGSFEIVSQTRYQLDWCQSEYEAGMTDAVKNVFNI